MTNEPKTPILDKLSNENVFWIDEDWTFTESCDYHYHVKLSKEEIIQIESIVNGHIQENISLNEMRNTAIETHSWKYKIKINNSSRVLYSE